MSQDAQEHEVLTKARQAFRKNNALGMHMYYATYLLQSPDHGKVLTEFLESARNLARGTRQIADVVPEGAFGKLLPQAPQKALEACLERLRLNPLDLDAVWKIGRTAQMLAHFHTAVAAYQEVLRLSPTARKPEHKLARLIRADLGRCLFRLKDYAAALSVLKEFEGDPEAARDLAQLLKDAVANMASQSFQPGEKSARVMATAESTELATQSPQQRHDHEVRDLEAQIADPNLDPGKRVNVALRLADHYGRGAQFERALALLRGALKACAGHCDLEKKLVETELRKRDHAIRKAEALAAKDEKARPALERLATEREDYVVQAFGDLAAKLPADGEVHLRLGEGLYQAWTRLRDEEVLKRAIGHLQFEFKADEAYNRSRLILARCFVGLGLPSAAEIVLAEFLARIEALQRNSPLYLEAQYLLGVVREETGDKRGAAMAYMQVVGKDIHYQDAFDRLRRLELR